MAATYAGIGGSQVKQGCEPRLAAADVRLEATLQEVSGSEDH